MKPLKKEQKRNGKNVQGLKQKEVAGIKTAKKSGDLFLNRIAHEF